MKIKKVKERKNELLNRTEYIFSIEHKGCATPSRAEIRKSIASQIGVKKECVVVYRITSKYGMCESIAKVFVYKSPELIPKYIVNKIVNRTKEGENGKGEEGEKKGEEGEKREETSKK